MSKRSIFVPEAGKPGGPYAHAVRAGDLLFMAGATPNRPDGTLVEGDFEIQARATFENLKIVAEADGANLSQAARVGVYLRDLKDFAAMNEIFAEYFGEEAPARTTLQADLPGFDIEVDAILYSPLVRE